MIADFLKKVSFEFRLNCRWLQLLKVFYMRFKTLNCRLRRHVGGRGSVRPLPPDFGRSEGTAGQRWRAALLPLPQISKLCNMPVTYSGTITVSLTAWSKMDLAKRQRRANFGYKILTELN